LNWRPVKFGVSLCCYSTASDSYYGSYPYGVEGIPGDNNHWIAGSNLPIRSEGAFIWPWYHVTVNSTYGGATGSGWYVIDDTVSPHASPYSEISAKERMTLTGWNLNGSPSSSSSFMVTGDMTLTAIYAQQYLITVNSQYGAALGSGWHGKGEKVLAGVSVNAVSDNGFLGELGFKAFLLGWTGDYTAVPADRMITLTVDSPKTITAIWMDSAWAIPLFILVLTAIAFVYARRRGPPKGMTAASNKRGDFCIECGHELPIKSKFCNECGTKQF